ncbi:MAG: isoprenylcysteine carboxylmethyltransferase family protein [Planctomycetes bacterium]|nr:isoprenylcysteine carboxylmethyltransferase family protein [Planctomycetota bacterium]
MVRHWVGGSGRAAAVALACYVAALLGSAALALLVLLLGMDARPSWLFVSLPTPWLIDAGWLVLFAVQHSGMARVSFKRVWTRWIPPFLERSVYAGLSGVLLLGLVATWQPLPGEPRWSGPAWLVVVALGFGAGLVLVNLSFDHAGLFGLRQVREQGQPPTPERLLVRGPYRWVRHPLMACLLGFLWTQPLMTPTLLVLVAGLTAYVAVALFLEEADLVRRFGDAYRDYRRRVPALVPWRRPAPAATFPAL